MLVKVVLSSILKNLEWPIGRPMPAAISDGSLNMGHVFLITVGIEAWRKAWGSVHDQCSCFCISQTNVKLLTCANFQLAKQLAAVLTASEQSRVQALTKAAPQQISARFRQPVSQALAGVPLREERPMTLMAIEAVTALICSGTVFTDQGTFHMLLQLVGEFNSIQAARFLDQACIQASWKLNQALLGVAQVVRLRAPAHALVCTVFKIYAYLVNRLDLIHLRATSSLQG